MPNLTGGLTSSTRPRVATADEELSFYDDSSPISFRSHNQEERTPQRLMQGLYIEEVENGYNITVSKGPAEGFRQTISKMIATREDLPTLMGRIINDNEQTNG